MNEYRDLIIPAILLPAHISHLQIIKGQEGVRVQIERKYKAAYHNEPITIRQERYIGWIEVVNNQLAWEIILGELLTKMFDQLASNEYCENVIRNQGS